MAFIITTTGAPGTVVIDDLGERTFVSGWRREGGRRGIESLVGDVLGEEGNGGTTSPLPLRGKSSGNKN